MTVQEATIAKIQRLPETLAQEVSDYVDFLITRNDILLWQRGQHLTENAALTGSALTDYLPNLEAYEERLARGEIQWQR